MDQRRIKTMATRNALKASQRGRKQPVRSAAILPPRQAGDPVRWKDRKGVFRRDIGDGEHSEVQIADRVYRVVTSELGYLMEFHD
jgi:hypothetical protein